jgi:hypothetical protein
VGSNALSIILMPACGSSASSIRDPAPQIYHPDGTARLVREDEALDGEDVVPGFRLPLAELFD